MRQSHSGRLRNMLKVYGKIYFQPVARIIFGALIFGPLFHHSSTHCCIRRTYLPCWRHTAGACRGETISFNYIPPPVVPRFPVGATFQSEGTERFCPSPLRPSGGIDGNGSHIDRHTDTNSHTVDGMALQSYPFVDQVHTFAIALQPLSLTLVFM